MAQVLNGLKYKGWAEVRVHVAVYLNQRIAILLWTNDGPLATATVNLPDQACGPDEVWVKDWSENEGMTDWLIANKIIVPGPVETSHD